MKLSLEPRKYTPQTARLGNPNALFRPALARTTTQLCTAQRQNLARLTSGRITPDVSHRLPLAQAAAALKLTLDRQVIGKAVLV
jgi:NADPH:quinone reductase-like Zn-dependent oxidoreductase